MASPRPSQRAPFGPTLALAVTLAVAAFAVVMPLVMGAVAPVVLPAPFPAQNQRAETLSYLLAFGVILPLRRRRRATAVRRDRRRPERRRPERAHGRAGGGAGGGAGRGQGRRPARGAGRRRTSCSPPRRPGGSAPGSCWRAPRAPGRGRRCWRSSAALRRSWALAALALLVALLCFAYLPSISVPGLVLCGLAAAAVAIAVHARVQVGRLPRRWGLAADLAALGALLLLVPDLVIFRPEEAAGDLAVGARDGHHRSSTTTSCSGRPTRCSTATRCSPGPRRSTASPASTCWRPGSRSRRSATARSGC